MLKMKKNEAYAKTTLAVTAVYTSNAEGQK